MVQESEKIQTKWKRTVWEGKIKQYSVEEGNISCEGQVYVKKIIAVCKSDSPSITVTERNTTSTKAIGQVSFAPTGIYDS